MKIFLSWSGERSKAVSTLLDEWLQCVIQAVDPWMSTKGIDRGAVWFDEISSQLQNTSIGIICLTKENLNKPWILFEAGALAKGLKTSLVCTFLVDLDSYDVSPPLSQFNSTMPDREGLWSLVTTLNSTIDSGNRLKEKTLEQVFTTYWPQFEEGFQKVLKNHPEISNIPERSESDILTEILQTTRGMDKRVRQLENQPLKVPGTTNLNFSKSMKTYDDTIQLAEAMYRDGISANSIHERLLADYNVGSNEATSVIRSVLGLKGAEVL